MIPKVEELISKLQALAAPEVLASQSRFGIVGAKRLGVSLYQLRPLAKGISDHTLSLELWQTGIHEARMLASMIDDAEKTTLEQMETWVNDFDSWDLCDITTDELFIHTRYCLDVIPKWAVREQEYVKRASFAMIAALVVHRKDISDEVVRGFFDLIEQAAGDNRNFVKKAVNWALRNIGKWRPSLRGAAVRCAERILEQGSPSARWIANDALREFEKKFGPLPQSVK